MPDKLTPKQAAFVAEYLADLSGAKAAIRAGFSEKTAKQQASQLLAKPHVAAAVEAGMAERAKRLELTQDKVLAELAKVAFASIGDFSTVGSNGERFIDLSTEDPDKLAAIAELTVEEFKCGRGEDARDVRRTKFKLHDKMSALNLSMRHLGMLNDKMALTGADGGPLQVDTTESAARIAAILEAARERKEAAGAGD
jgi:phage terminase small subunit